MCRSIKRLRRPDGPPTDEELRAAALQFVRQVSGYRAPSRANQEAFDRAVDDIAATSGMENEIKFCPRCGHSLEWQETFGGYRPTCPACNYVHFFDPKVAAAALIERDGKVLLVRRVMNPEQGKWTVPGGFVNAHEDPRKAAERECYEETGLSVEVTDLVDVLYTQEHPRSASIVIFYRGRVLGGELRASDDADRVAFFGPDEWPEVAFNTTRTVLEKWAAERDG